MQEAKELLQSLEALQAAEMTTPPPRAHETEEEAQDEPPGKKPRLRRKKSKRACADEADDDGLGKEKATPEKRRPKPKPSARRPPRSPPVTGGATSSGLQAQETLVDNGEDAQPTFPSDELPTPFKSTQKDLSLATPKASSREPPIPEPSPKFTPKPSSPFAPPDTSDGSGDEILQYALQQKMVEVSSGEENWNPAESWYAIALLIVRCCSMFCVWDAILFDKETDIYYGTPLKVRAIFVYTVAEPKQ